MNSNIRTPRVIWYGGKSQEILIVEAVVGVMIWEFIDPRRELYDTDKRLLYLQAYGESLAKLHNLDISWPSQKRPRLYGLIGEEKVEDDRFKQLVSWIQSNSMNSPNEVFVHGDFNTAGVIFHRGTISGVIDWEFAGSEWREYDLAWMLRARLSFLNTEQERRAILDGYRQHSAYDEESLKWCEVLNYLHFAYWSKKNKSNYTSFALNQAMLRAGAKINSHF